MHNNDSQNRNSDIAKSKHFFFFIFVIIFKTSETFVVASLLL